MITIRRIAAPILMLLGAASCATTVDTTGSEGSPTGQAPSPSVVSGSLALETFPTALSSVRVVSDAGETAVSVGADGRFTATLAPGATYRLLLGDAASEIPIVLRAVAGRLDTTVRVGIGGASFDLGGIQYRAGGAQLVSPTEDAEGTCTEEEDDEEGEDHECEDGIDPATGAECDGGPAANQDDGEEEDDDAPEDTDAAIDDALGVPTFNLPASLDCEDEGDDDEGDEEQEGEHEDGA